MCEANIRNIHKHKQIEIVSEALIKSEKFVELNCKYFKIKVSNLINIR